jgi:MFS family permease
MSATNRFEPADPDGESDEDHHRRGAAMTGLPAEAPLITRPFARLLAMQMGFGFAFSAFLLLPKVLTTAFAATPGEIGLVMAAFGLGSLIAIPVVGPVVRALGDRGALVLANLLLAAGALGFVLVHGAGAPAVLLRGLHGVAWSLGFAVGMAVAADLAPPSRLAQAVGIFGAASLAMNAVAPAIAEPLGERFGHRVVFALASAAALLGALAARGLPKRTRQVHGVAVMVGTSPPSAPRAVVYLIMGVSGLSFGVMFTFIAPFALEHGVRAVRGFFAAYTVSALAVRILAARLADRLGYRCAAFGGTLLYGLTVAATGAAGPAHLVLVGAFFGTAHGAVFPAVMALLLTDARGAERARALGLANGALNLGVASVLGLGWIAGRLGYPAVFYLAGALNVMAAPLLHRGVGTSRGDGDEFALGKDQRGEGAAVDAPGVEAGGERMPL